MFERVTGEPVTLKRHVPKYKNMRKWMDKFLRKSESLGDKVARVNSIRITKSINFFKFWTVLRSVVRERERNFPCTVHL